jgi:hypothetical protein
VGEGFRAFPDLHHGHEGGMEQRRHPQPGQGQQRHRFAASSFAQSAFHHASRSVVHAGQIGRPSCNRACTRSPGRAVRGREPPVARMTAAVMASAYRRPAGFPDPAMASMPSRAWGVATTGRGHGHAFQDLVLDAPGDAQGRHHGGGMGQPGADVLHAAGHQDAIPASQGLDLRRGLAADDGEQDFRSRGAQGRQDLMGEPDHRVDIGPVIHGAGEGHHLRLPAG